jgi:predicted PurR-regulated permease PerM
VNNPRAVVIISLVVLAGVLLYLLAPILTPFLAGALFAYIANPLVIRLTRWRVPRGLAVALVFLLIITLVTALLVFLIPLIQRQVASFVQKLPQYLDWAQRTLIPRIEQLAGRSLPIDAGDLRAIVSSHWEEIVNFIRAALTNLATSGLRVALSLLNIVLIPIVTFYLLLDWDRLRFNALQLFSPSVRPTVVTLATETDDVLGSFLRGQLLVMLCLAVIYSTGLAIVGLDLALPIGIAAGLISFVPYLGFVVGIASASVAAYLQFQDGSVLLWVFLVFFIAQMIEGYLLTPRLVGSRIGLHPVAVIFAVMAGGQLFGFLGVLLALPVAAALKVWLRYLHRSYLVPPPKAPRPPRRTRTAGEAKVPP